MPQSSASSTPSRVRSPPPTWTESAHRREDLPDRFALHGPTRLRPVEIDDVQPPDAVGREAARDPRRILVVDRRRVVAPLRKPHGAAAEQVDRGNQLEGRARSH